MNVSINKKITKKNFLLILFKIFQKIILFSEKILHFLKQRTNEGIFFFCYFNSNVFMIFFNQQM